MEIIENKEPEFKFDIETGKQTVFDLKLSSAAGTTNYNELQNKPLINSIVLEGDKDISELGLQPAGEYATVSELPTKVSQLSNDSGYLNSIPAEYITESELNSKGYLTEHQDISGKADKVDTYTKTEVNNLIDDINNTIGTIGIELDSINGEVI